MKILFAIKNLADAAGGAERVLCMVSSVLAARGHDVTVLTFDPAGSSAFYEIDPRVKRVDLGIGQSTKRARLVEFLKRMAALRRELKQQRPDVAIGFMHSMFIPLAFSALRTGLAVVGSEHIVPEHYRKRPLQFGLFLMAAPLMEKITVLSESIRVRYPALIRKKMVPIVNPVMTAEAVDRTKAHKERRLLLTVGRLDPQKDHATLIRSFAKVATDFPHWDLRIVGEGPLRSSLEALIERLGFEHRVSLPGLCSDMSAVYREADIFASSSRYESFGLAAAEAMSYGLPVVAFSDCPGTNELIENGKTGILVVPGIDRVLPFADELAKLMRDEALRQCYGQEARVFVGQQFSVQLVADLWENFLQRVTDEKMRVT